MGLSLLEARMKMSDLEYVAVLHFTYLFVQKLGCSGVILNKDMIFPFSWIVRCSSMTWIQFLAFMHGWRREMDNCMWLIWIALMEHMWMTKESDLELLLLFSLEAMWHLVSFHFLIPLLFRFFSVSLYLYLSMWLWYLLSFTVVNQPCDIMKWFIFVHHGCWFHIWLAIVVNFMKIYQFKLRGL